MDTSDTVIARFFHGAHTHPDRTVLLFEGTEYTYVALAERVVRLGRELRAWGLAPGDRVALFLENSPQFVVAYLGVHAAGGVVVLVNSGYRSVELRHILHDSGAVLCVTGAEGAAALAPLRGELPALRALLRVDGSAAPGDLALVWDASGRAGAPVDQPIPLPRGDDLAILAYTSGTTGRAKGAMLLHRNLASNIATLTRSWEWQPEDRLLLTLPLFHAHGLMVGLHGTLWTGASVELHRRFDAAVVFARLQQDARLTMFFGVPTMYARLLAEAAARGVTPRAIRLYVSGSAPLSAETFDAFQQLFGQPILERYGMTETIMNTTNPYRGERRAGSVGHPFPGQEARVVDVRTRAVLPAGETGEIEVRGPHVCAGYWQNPQATAESFLPDGWFRTGDLGQIDTDGYLVITGRARELIITGGYNVYPREVEEVLATHPGVAEVAVVGRPDADLGEQVVAYVVAGTPAPAAEELGAYCRERLAAYKKPRAFIFVDALPRNAMGKVQKHLLGAGDR